MQGARPIKVVSMACHVELAYHLVREKVDLGSLVWVIYSQNFDTTTWSENTTSSVNLFKPLAACFLYIVPHTHTYMHILLE